MSLDLYAQSVLSVLQLGIGGFALIIAWFLWSIYAS